MGATSHTAVFWGYLCNSPPPPVLNELPHTKNEPPQIDLTHGHETACTWTEGPQLFI